MIFRRLDWWVKTRKTAYKARVNTSFIWTP